jgi:hypothetical protein
MVGGTLVDIQTHFERKIRQRWDALPASVHSMLQNQLRSA